MNKGCNKLFIYQQLKTICITYVWHQVQVCLFYAQAEKKQKKPKTLLLHESHECRVYYSAGILPRGEKSAAVLKAELISFPLWCSPAAIISLKTPWQLTIQKILVVLRRKHPQQAPLWSSATSDHLFLVCVNKHATCRWQKHWSRPLLFLSRNSAPSVAGLCVQVGWFPCKC